jgi:hypothetical protein
MELGVRMSGLPCEWPKPGRSTAIIRPVSASAGQTRRKANRLSGQGLVSRMAGRSGVPESAYLTCSSSTSTVRVRMVVAFIEVLT